MFSGFVDIVGDFNTWTFLDNVVTHPVCLLTVALLAVALCKVNASQGQVHRISLANNSG